MNKLMWVANEKIIDGLIDYLDEVYIDDKLVFSGNVDESFKYILKMLDVELNKEEDYDTYQRALLEVEVFISEVCRNKGIKFIWVYNELNNDKKDITQY